MNRLETIAVFKAIKSLAKMNAVGEIEDLADTVLYEAQTKPEKSFDEDDAPKK